MSLSVLGRQARRKYLLDDAHQLRITGFQSPAADDAERPLSLDALIGLGAPHIWPVRVDDNTLEPFGMYQGDILIVDRSANAVANSYLVVDVEGAYLVRMVVRRDGVLLLKPPVESPRSREHALTDVEIFGMVIGAYWSARPF
jgi:DNA polymerase V